MLVPVRFRSVRVLSILVLGAACAGLPAATAAAAPKPKPLGKPFEVVVATAYAGETVADYTVTITNLATTQQLGSVNLQIPAPMVIAGDQTTDHGTILEPKTDHLVELRDLNLAPNGGKATVKLGLQMPCEKSGLEWLGIEGKQSNDFSGQPGNAADLVSTPVTVLQGNCHLSFSAQPASAKTGTEILADAFAAALGPAPEPRHPVTVEALDGKPTPQLMTWFTGAVALDSDP